MLTTHGEVTLTGRQFQILIDEGWRFYFDEKGAVLGYLPPTLTTRLERLK